MANVLSSVRSQTLSADLLRSRREVLTKIAEQYHDLTDPSASSHTNGTGERVPIGPHERHCLMVTTHGRLQGVMRCTCAYRTVREFERLLRTMREGRHALVHVGHEKHSPRALRWHLTGWYIDAVRVVRHYPKPRVKGHKLQVATGQEILRDASGAFVPSQVSDHVVRVHGARLELAQAGLQWIAERWPESAGEPMLPSEIQAAA